MEVILSCRLLLNLRSAVESSASKLAPAVLPWSENSNNNPSNGVIIGDQFRSTELVLTQGREMKLEPARLQPIDIRVESTQWNAQTLYTN